jgi:hypothetical protein
VQPSFRLDLREASGALGDLGTLLPLMLGAIAVGGLSAQPVLAGFAVFYAATALVYRLPVPVQPMKAIAALLLVGGATPASVALAGAIIGGVLILLALTGWAARLARLVPQSVLAGLQLGLGIALGLVAIKLMGSAPLAGVLSLACVAALLFAGLPAALLFLAAALPVGLALDLPGIALAVPGETALAATVQQLVLPQLSLTLTNAILLTALVAKDCWGEAARDVTPKRLALTSGIANLCLAPFGALPMCHGAGGVTAHHRFGARTGAAPLMLAAALLAVALVPGAPDLLARIPAAALGALLMIAAVDLAAQKRIVDCKPSCRPVIAVTALATVVVDPFIGLVAGTAAEAIRVAVVRRLYGPKPERSLRS